VTRPEHVPADQVVDDADVESALAQKVHHVAADKSGASRNERDG